MLDVETFVLGSEVPLELVLTDAAGATLSSTGLRCWVRHQRDALTAEVEVTIVAVGGVPTATIKPSRAGLWLWSATWPGPPITVAQGMVEIVDSNFQAHA